MANPIYEHLLQIESKYELNSKEIDGYKMWTYSRLSILYDALSTGASIPVSFGEIIRYALPKLFRAASMLFRTCAPKIQNPDILFICHGSRRLSDGVYESYITDDIAALYPNSITLEHPTQDLLHFSPVNTKNLIYSDRFLICGLISGLLNRYLRTGKYKKVYNEVKKELYTPLSEFFPKSPEAVNRWITWMSYFYFTYKSQYRSYEKFLSKVSPSLIVESNNRVEHMIVNEIAKKSKIPTVELQHGIFHNELSGYYFPSDNSIPQLPDYLLLFSEFSKEILLPCSVDESKLIPVGYPYFEKQVKKYTSRAKLNSKSKTLVILSLPSPESLALEKLAIEIYPRLKELGWDIVFKLHPLECNNWQSVYSLLASSEIEVVDSPNTNLYELFSQSDALIGISSTGIYEGIGFNLAAFVYDVPGSESMGQLCSKGFATKILDSNHLCFELENLDTAHQKNSSELFKPNALENMKQVLDQLLAQEESKG